MKKYDFWKIELGVVSKDCIRVNEETVNLIKFLFREFQINKSITILN